AEVATSPESPLDHPELLELGEDLAGDVAFEIRQVLIDDPPAQWREGGFVRRGFAAELDELTDLSEGGKGKILEIEARERERTGISSLKVRYNRVFGYYLEITRSNLARVPSDYIRKQTLANSERYVTSELADYEAKILGADERRVTLELEAFERLRADVAKSARRLLQLGETVARLDALASLAEVAHTSDYSRPEVDDSLALEIEDGRHPVVERLAARGQFVPNDTRLDPDGAQIMILTGPNMAGKSTAMRQAALITLLAQMGSFVPARRARVGVVDRVFTRVGASDNLARGDSTFMVEMRETANILAHATRRSLVVLDEIGRGTSTYDGMAIAWAVAEHLHDRIGCKTMFATHYHELTALERSRPRVRNFSTAVREWKDEVVFLHKLQPGGASRSYGIQVARLAGLEASVIARAKAIVTALERGEDLGGILPQLEDPLQPALPFAASGERERPRERERKPEPSEVERALAAADVDGLSPREALAFLAELQAKLR
ncbi:MAG TPA: DNA mismatch repair protein MutS, partial [Polyangia bacterium]|nr:DNA mismatch repair protein MutS [Polyangia bacterium]